VSDVLGLGDIAFPAMLAGWVRRYDRTPQAAQFRAKVALYPATLGGYVLGCVMCELFQTGQGQPALLYIVPSMLLTTKLAALFRGDLLKMARYDPEGVDAVVQVVEE
jgi:minor histocompatibility antigen H13